MVRRMLSSKKKNKSWLQAFSKSVLAVFILQVFLSAVCIATADAETSVRVLPATAHCQNVSMHDENGNQNVVCTHCDSPDTVLSSHSVAVSDISVVLLAIIVLPHVPELSLSQRMDAVDAYASSDSATLLYQTTRRILI